VLSEGTTNEVRDRVTKRGHYGDWGVQKYWIVDRFARSVEVYRPVDGTMQLIAALGEWDDLSSPLLPGFSLRVEALFADLPS
jgi:Uma2 family endonuclease